MTGVMERITNHKEIRRFIQFGLVGVVGTVVDFGLLVILKEVAGLPTGLANVLSYSAGIVNNFTLNKVWTFADANNKGTLTQFLQFALVSLVGLALNTGIVVGLELVLDEIELLAAYEYIFAKVVATGIVLFWNFGANRLWTFSETENVR